MQSPKWLSRKEVRERYKTSDSSLSRWIDNKRDRRDRRDRRNHRDRWDGQDRRDRLVACTLEIILQGLLIVVVALGIGLFLGRCSL